MNKEEQEHASECESFVEWLKKELKSSNREIDIAHGTLSEKDAQALLKEIVHEIKEL